MVAEGGRGQRLRLYSLMSLQNLCNYTARMAIAFTVPFVSAVHVAGSHHAVV